MALPAGQQGVLDGIEEILRSRDPRLASMFSIFTRLAGQDPMPRLEQLVPQGQAMAARVGRRLGRVFPPRYRLGAIMIVPVVLIVIICFAVLGPLTRGPGCGSAPQARTTAAMAGRRAVVCAAHRAGNTTALQH
jgi:hypothetical protein